MGFFLPQRELGRITWSPPMIVRPDGDNAPESRQASLASWETVGAVPGSLSSTPLGTPQPSAAVTPTMSDRVPSRARRKVPVCRRESLRATVGKRPMCMRATYMDCQSKGSGYCRCNSATHSMCGVPGCISYGVTCCVAYPCSCSQMRSRSRLLGLQLI